ncbi:MAG: benzoate/H(+) symporter BenE family transporter [Anaerolineae bacterium]|nr:benzoate/H(+) symporter BenE family transporter [Anaerolineae bacterium]NUQ04529.1 benzoate/H(+) symporter BenE family transporter [Anaerolineae bacterium]
MAAHPTLLPAARPSLAGFLRNLRDLPSTISVGSVTAGFIVMLISYTGPILILLEAARAGGLSPEQTSSWVMAVVVGGGFGTILLSLLYRQPINLPYSTAGAALLITSLTQFSLPEAVGAYIVAGLAVALLGVSGLFGRLMRVVPQTVALAVLAGVLLRFGMGVFNAIDDAPNNPLMIAAMVGVFFLLRRRHFRAPSLGALAVGILVAAALGQIAPISLKLAPTTPVFTAPVFTLNAALGIALPLVILALSSQYAPGMAVLRGNGYEPPVNGILIGSGLLSSALAFFGGHSSVLGALTAAIVVGPDAQPDPDKRYGTAVISGLWHVVVGMFGAAVVDFFDVFPPVFVSTIAGLSLSGVIASSLGGALHDLDHRDAAVIAFLCTAGDFTLLGIGAPFWGLIVGVLVNALMHGRRLRSG